MGQLYPSRAYKPKQTDMQSSRDDRKAIYFTLSAFPLEYMAACRGENIFIGPVPEAFQIRTGLLTSRYILFYHCQLGILQHLCFW